MKPFFEPLEERIVLDGALLLDLSTIDLGPGNDADHSDAGLDTLLQESSVFPDDQDNPFFHHPTTFNVSESNRSINGTILIVLDHTVIIPKTSRTNNIFHDEHDGVPSEKNINLIFDHKIDHIGSQNKNMIELPLFTPWTSTPTYWNLPGFLIKSKPDSCIAPGNLDSNNLSSSSDPMEKIVNHMISTEPESTPITDTIVKKMESIQESKNVEFTTFSNESKSDVSFPKTSHLWTYFNFKSAV